MVAIAGTYNNGYVKLDKEYSIKKPVKVIVTFLEEEVPEDDGKRLTLSDFSFAESQEVLKNVKGDISDLLIAERREE